MTKEFPSHIVRCNGAESPNQAKSVGKSVVLDYQARNNRPPNVNMGLPNFVSGVYHLPDRILDLLELASYVYCADRSVVRGAKDALEYQGWSRSFHFIVRVRDLPFWDNPVVKSALNEVLSFMSGDREFRFTFQSGHSTPPTSLFDSEQFKLVSPQRTRIVLFSGGVDSLTGAYDCLEHGKEHICLVSHRSGQTGTARTQDALVRALHASFPKRLSHYKFRCSLSGLRAQEETQRTRMFLYSSIAFALAHAFSQKTVYVYENGITSLNFARRQDLLNARATRTTHPKTIFGLEKLFSLVEGSAIKIETPFFWKTKSDVLQTLGNLQKKDLITSAVSCSKTFLKLGQATHCGGCSQCIDRRFAAYASCLDDLDESGIYLLNFITERISDGEVKTTLVDFLRQACDFASWNVDHFQSQLLSELAQITPFIPAKSEEEVVENIYQLSRRHGAQVLTALKRMRDLHDNLFKKPPKDCLLTLTSEREYLKTPVLRLVEDICTRLRKSLPIAYQRRKPDSEPELNDMVSATLNRDKDDFEREHPSIAFALARAVPDHSFNTYELLVESKYIRGSTSPSKANEGISADLVKYPGESHLLFLVYDPEGKIHNVGKFAADLEQKRANTTVCVIR